MLEAHAHQQLKQLLLQERSAWPHHLTLSRLIARGLRRRDHALIQLSPCSQDQWWLGLLVPLCLQSRHCVLVLEDQQRQRLLQVERPRLQAEGLQLPCWQGLEAPQGDQLWLLNTQELVEAQRLGLLRAHHLLIIPEADQLSQRLRRAMALTLTASDWESLRRAQPSADGALLELYERLSRQLFGQATHSDASVRLQSCQLQSLRDLLSLLQPLPAPWARVLAADPQHWASWAQLDHRLLQWSWHLQALEPLNQLHALLKDHPILLLSSNGNSGPLQAELRSAGFQAEVHVHLREPSLLEPVPLFAPRRQPLPNTEVYAQHLLEQSRRLILGRAGMTIVLLNDPQMRQRLTSELAGEFGSRVLEQATAPEANGVICCSWEWWLTHQSQLPAPDQLIVALLPIASLESPLTAARVEALKQQGRDWFRELLLPEALSLMAPAIAPLRRSGGRLAVLDGRLRGRSWGEQVFQALQPWTPLHRLLPD